MPYLRYDNHIFTACEIFPTICYGSPPEKVGVLSDRDKRSDIMSITSDFSKFKKIDAHSHIGTFGSPFNIHFNADLLLKQMEEFNIEKTILCSDGPHTNEETVAAFKAHPDKIIPLMWINCAEGKPAYDALEHYIRDEHFAGAKLQSLFDGYCADDPCVDPVAEICEKYGKPLFIHSGHPPFSLP